MIRIIEERWSINRINGERSTVRTDEKIFYPISGSVMEMPIGRRTFTVDDVNKNSVTVSVHYENNPFSNKTWTIPKGESIIYRPMSRDGGYKYTIICEDVIIH